MSCRALESNQRRSAGFDSNTAKDTCSYQPRQSETQVNRHEIRQLPSCRPTQHFQRSLARSLDRYYMEAHVANSPLGGQICHRCRPVSPLGQKSKTTSMNVTMNTRRRRQVILYGVPFIISFPTFHPPPRAPHLCRRSSTTQQSIQRRNPATLATRWHNQPPPHLCKPAIRVH